MFWLFIQLALSSALFFQKLGKFVAYCLRDKRSQRSLELFVDIHKVMDGV